MIGAVMRLNAKFYTINSCVTTLMHGWMLSACMNDWRDERQYATTKLVWMNGEGPNWHREGRRHSVGAGRKTDLQTAMLPAHMVIQ